MLVAHVSISPMALTFLKGQVGFMKERGFEVTAITSPGEDLDEFGRQQHVAVHPLPMARDISPLRDLRALLELRRVLREIRPTVVHSHTPKGGLMGTLAAVLAGVPVRIYHMRGLSLMTETGSRRALLRWAEKLTCLAAHHVVCVSPSLRTAALDERLCAADKIEVLAGGSGNGVDAAGRFNPERLAAGQRSTTRARLGIPDDAVVIGFVGRVNRQKGIVELLGAFDRLRTRHADLHLLVVGEMEDHDRAPPDVLRELREGERVHWPGFDWDSPPLYAAMDVVALPTYREGFPNVPLEAAAMALPVVATRVTGCVDAVQDGRTGLLVPPRDAAALAEALERYVTSPALRREHGAAGRERVLRSFKQELIWEALYARYCELAARSGVGSTAVRRK